MHSAQAEPERSESQNVGRSSPTSAIYCACMVPLSKSEAFKNELWAVAHSHQNAPYV